MIRNLEVGTCVVAVSGGVDSMVLLDMLTKQKDLRLIVAHFDHGIRPDSASDRKFVQQVAKKDGLQFEFAEGNLGPKASEEIARKARYDFLRRVRQKYQADAIITAHHQDDMIETALINMLRGTGRKGLSSLGSTDDIKRPLLDMTKAEILDYAAKHNITWREDETNQDAKYLRNYVRKTIMATLTTKQREQLVDLIRKSRRQNEKTDLEIANYLQTITSGRKSEKINKKQFVLLPHAVASEIMAAWLRLNDIRDFDRKTIERLVIAAKTLQPGQRSDVNRLVKLEVGKTKLALVRSDR